jgi:hypothetical protein
MKSDQTDVVNNLNRTPNEPGGGEVHQQTLQGYPDTATVQNDTKIAEIVIDNPIQKNPRQRIILVLFVVVLIMVLSLPIFYLYNSRSSALTNSKENGMSGKGVGNSEVIENQKQSEEFFGFLSPVNGSTYKYGDTMLIEISPGKNKSILFVAPGVVEEFESISGQTITYRLPISLDLAGKENSLMIVGKKNKDSKPLDDSDEIDRAQLNFNVGLEGVNFTSLRITAPYLLRNGNFYTIEIPSGEKSKILVEGEYNGEFVDISSSRLGTVYSPLVSSASYPDTSKVFSIDEDGTLTAVGPGVASVVIRHKDMPSESIMVVVK